MSDVLYRYVETHYAAASDDFEYVSGSGSTEVTLRTYRVIRRTPCGVWIEEDFGDFHLLGSGPRFVNLTARKRFACPTKAEARESFKARKRRQIKILKAQIARAERALAALERLSEVAA